MSVTLEAPAPSVVTDVEEFLACHPWARMYKRMVLTLDAAREVYRAIGWRPVPFVLYTNDLLESQPYADLNRVEGPYGGERGCLIGAWTFYLSNGDYRAAMTPSGAERVLGKDNAKVYSIELGFDAGVRHHVERAEYSDGFDASYECAANEAAQRQVSYGMHPMHAQGYIAAFNIGYRLAHEYELAGLE